MSSGWYAEQEQKMALVMARLDAKLRMWEMLGCIGPTVDQPLNVGLQEVSQGVTNGQVAAQEASA